MGNIDLGKLQKVSHKLGTESGELGVKLFHKTITEFEAINIQKKRCINIVRDNGLAFAAEVYHMIYTIITSINLKRQKEGNKPIEFYTKGMDEYFQGLGIKEYDG